MHGPRTRHQDLPAVLAGVLVLLVIAGVAQAAGKEGSFDPGDLGQAIIAIAIFLVLLLVLGKFAWKPVIAQLKSREDRIGQAITQAEKRQAQAEDLLAKYEARMQGAKDEVEHLLAAAREQAEAHRQDLVAQARQEAERSVRQARHDIARAKAEAMQEMREETARMAVALAERVLQREVSAADQERLLRQTLEDIAQHAGEEA